MPSDSEELPPEKFRKKMKGYKKYAKALKAQLDSAEVNLARSEAERTALQTENAELKTKLAASEDDKVALQFAREGEIQAAAAERKGHGGKGGGKGKVGAC